MHVIELWFRDESLPTDAFRQSQTVTALGLQTLSQPLRERREGLLPFVVEAEQRLFEAFRAIHNAYAADWGHPRLTEDFDLDVVLGDIDVPVDPMSLTQQLAADMQLRLGSPINAMMARHGITRDEAIKRRRQVDDDFEEYGLEQPPGASEAIQGQRPANADPAPGEMNPAASNLQRGRQAMTEDDEDDRVG